MEHFMVVTLIITLITGSGRVQSLLPPGPINGEVGKSALFTPIPSSETITAIRWIFGAINVVKYSSSGLVEVDSAYMGRVDLNSSTGELSLHQLTLNDSGQYTVILTFASGLGTQGSVLLQVYEALFNIRVRGPEGKLIENSGARFTCEGNGTNANTVWTKGSVILGPSSSISFMDDNRTMVFSPLMRSDSGVYQCVMSNPVSNGAATFSITVNYGPDVTILGVQTLEKGSDILLLCSADSFPPATVSWIVQGMSSVDTPLYVKENSNPSDSGDYSCTCTNNVTGITASAVTILTVKAVSSRLVPGAEAGITLGVIFAVVVLPALIFFLVKHFKKPTGPVGEAPTPMTVNQTDDTNTGFTLSRTATEISNPLPADRHLYENTRPSKAPTPPPRDKLIHDSQVYSNTIDTVFK